MKILSNLTDNLVKHCLSKNSHVEAKILLNWDKIASENSKITFPEKVRFKDNTRNNGTLILNVQNGFSLLIQMKIPELLNKINDFIGYKAINKIKIKQVDLKYKLSNFIYNRKFD